MASRTIWITRYALKRGIIEKEITDANYRASHQHVSVGPFYCFKRDWYATLEAAKVRVLQMVAAKRKSLAKQLAALDKLEGEMQS